MYYPDIGLTALISEHRLKLRWSGLGMLLVLLLAAPQLWAQQRQGISDAAVTELANRAMKEFDVPGMAIGIIKSQELVFAKGFGVREIGKKGNVNGATMFNLASNSKAFTSAALATLVDDGSISWDGLVIDYIPEFRMKDPWVTAGFTVTDLLTHRSGLPAFIGDMLLWPKPNSFTTADIIFALRHFEQSSGFRTKYAYDNLLYIVAGEIIPRVSEQTWGQLVEQRLMRPAGMTRCFADKIPKRQMKNLAAPHGVIEGELSVIERNRTPAQPPVSAPAGAIICSLDDMLTWVRTQLNNGTTPDGTVLFSEQQSREMWKPKTLLNVSERDYELNKTHFKAYGLGWRLADVNGFKEVSHTGSLSGVRSKVVMIPELELGVVFLSNGSSSAARAAVVNTIVRSYLPVEQVDFIQKYLDAMEADKLAASLQQRSDEDSEKQAQQTMLPCHVPELSLFTGVYRDPWFGDVSIQLEQGELVFASKKSPKLTGALTHSEGRQFVVRWFDRTLEADAYVLFETDDDGQVNGMSMSKLDRGDFDFEDLDLSKVE
jgi:CubicO group peptidase (beta-lactamase class C family)